MFFQPPDEEELNCSKTLKINSRSRRKKKLRRKNKLKRLKQRALKKYQIATKQKAPRTPVPPTVLTPVPTVPITMSSWAENFNSHAIWKLKHEVAFWKSKAVALEHENKILHETIRQNCVYKESNNSSESSESGSEDELQETPPAEQPSDEDLEISEEYIQFLMANRVYRESARQEREKMKAKYDVERKQIEEMEAGPSDNVVNPQETLKKLYGDAWERIAALDMSLQIQFMSICDQEKPPYWPNIPFNFNYS